LAPVSAAFPFCRPIFWHLYLPRIRFFFRSFGYIHFLICRQFLCHFAFGQNGLSRAGGLVWMFYGRNHSSRLSTPTGGHTGTVPPASLRPAAVTALLSA